MKFTILSKIFALATVMILSISICKAATSPSKICKATYGYGSSAANACLAGSLNFYNSYNALKIQFINSTGRSPTIEEAANLSPLANNNCSLFAMPSGYQAIFNYGCTLGWVEFTETLQQSQ